DNEPPRWTGRSTRKTGSEAVMEASGVAAARSWLDKRDRDAIRQVVLSRPGPIFCPDFGFLSGHLFPSSARTKMLSYIHFCASDCCARAAQLAFMDRRARREAS